jgi:dTDP-4-amino-4,6-dideoxygalactose transaminase
VITVSHSFIATANAIRYTGADPVFVDIQLDDFNIDPARIEEAITPRTKALMCVHQIGMPCRIDEITEIATRHGLKLIEDAACAAGSAIKNPDGGWQKIGAPYGDVTCFSFHPRKMITTGDGGMIIAKDEALAARLRRLRQHGMSVNDLVRHRSHKPVFETYDELGFNYRMTDIQAAIGREQLKRLDKLVASRRDLAHRYSALLAKVPGVTVPQEREGVRTNWQSYCVLLPETASQMAVMDYMQQQGIAVRRGVMCAHKEPAYAQHKVTHDLSLSEIAQIRGVILPLFDGLQDKDMIRVAAALKQGLAVS